MLKKFFFSIAILFGTSQLCYGMTIPAHSDYNVISGCSSSKYISTSASFGKLPIPGDYGIFINVRFNSSDSGPTAVGTAFFRLEGYEIIRDRKGLFIQVGEKKVQLATKKFYGWKTLNNVKIGHSRSCKTEAWLTIED